MDAKCTIRDRRLGGGAGVSTKVDRHHRRIPAEDCTCGIYGSADEALEGVHLAPSGVPLVTGLVELSGRVIRSGSHLRAQHASIVGPLALDLGRPPFGVSMLRRIGLPAAAADEREATIDRAVAILVTAGKVQEVIVIFPSYFPFLIQIYIMMLLCKLNT